MQCLLLLVGTLQTQAGEDADGFVRESSEVTRSAAGEGCRHPGACTRNQEGRRHREERQSEKRNQGEVGEILEHDVHRSICRLSQD